MENKNVYVIPAAKFDRLQERLKAMARKAKRLNLAPVELKVLKVEHKAVVRKRKEVEMTFYHVEIIGEKPVLNGWKFLATLQVTPNGTLVKVVPGESLPERFYHTENICEHCNMNRRRNEIYVVQNIETGEYRQVGKNCLEDFTGYGANPAGIADYYEWLGTLDIDLNSDDDNDYTGGHSVSNFLCLETYLKYVSATIRKYGWVPISKAKEYGNVATAYKAINEMFPHPLYYKRTVDITEEDKKLAHDAIEWAKSLEGNLNEYLHNLKVLALNTVLKYDMVGFAASMIVAYKNNMRKDNEEKAQRQEKNRQVRTSEYVGIVGEYGVWELTVKKVKEVSSQFGTKLLHILHDNSGNIFVWFANDELEIGKTYKIRGKVKEHREFNGVKQTCIYYAKVV